jgi:hypothetical protein
MFDDIVLYIRRRTREQYQQLVVDSLISFRIWVEENGPRAALLTFVLGMFVVLLFKLVIILLLLGILFGFAVWSVAQSASQTEVIRSNGSSF